MRTAIFRRVTTFETQLQALTPLRASIGPAADAYLACTPTGTSRRGRSLQVLRSAGRDLELVLEVSHPGGLPLVQPLPGGTFLIAVPRSPRRPDGSVTPNAWVYGATGNLIDTWLLGDGLEDMQCTAAGDVWTTYTATGTMGDYGRFGWGRLGPEVWIEPIGGPGLMRFDAQGEASYSYRPPTGMPIIMDCYALNVASNRVWATYHPGFALLGVDYKERSDWWASDLGPQDALAIDGDLVLGYAAFRSKRYASLGRLAGSALRKVDNLEVRLSDGAPAASIEWVVGRGSTLHAFSRTAWYSLDLAAIRLSSGQRGSGT